MAKAKFGMIVTDMRNKLGGHVFSKNRAGAIVRTKVTPTNPQTINQQISRAILGSISSAWAGLTDDQRATFNNAVESWQRTDIFGDLKKPTGKNLFTALNKNLEQSGQAQVTAAPAKVEVPFLGLVAPVISIADTEINLDFANVPAGFVMQVSATPYLSQGIQYVRGRFRVIDYVPAGAISPTDLYDALVAKFGVPTVGANVYIQVKLIGANGQAGVPETAKAAVEA